MEILKNNVMTVEQFKEVNYGELGTAKRDKLEAGYKRFVKREARTEKFAMPDAFVANDGSAKP